MPRSQSEKENVQFVQELAEVDGPFESPININYRDLIKLELPSLSWNRIESWPKKMKVTNTGHTVIISGKWKSERPFLTGGPLIGKYVFSQIHFHWGQDECKGSEHQICGEGFPLEMHVAHFKTDYLSQENALKEKDGMVVLVYLFKLQNEPNAAFKKILSLLPNVKQPCTSQAFEPRPILSLVNPFTDDYFMYWGSVITPTCAHILLWLICREPLGISREQVEEFRKIMDSSQQPIFKNNRDVQPVHKRNVFHVNAGRELDNPLLPIKQMLGCYCKGSQEDVDLKMEQADGHPPNDCACLSNRNQEEIEGDIPDDKTKIFCPGIKGNRKSNSSPPRSVYTKQDIHLQHAIISPPPLLAKKYESEMIKKVHYPVGKQTKSEDNIRTNLVSQSCCFYPMEKINRIKTRPDRRKNREKKKSNSFRAFSNILSSLEALKNHTFKKLKEIDAINQEIKGMKSFCESAEDKRWLRKIEKVMTIQKHFTIKKSQNCFGELKKLAKECNFDKLFDGKQFPNGKNYQEVLRVKSTENENNPALPGPETNDKKEDGIDQANKYSIKAQKVIQSFFEDIKDTEDLQKTVQKNLQLKKIESSHNKEAGDSNLINSKGYITEKMFIMGNLGDRFFTEVTTEVETEEDKTEEVIITVAAQQNEGKKYRKAVDSKGDSIIPLHKATELPKLNESSDEFENYYSLTNNLISLSDTETTSDHEMVKFTERNVRKKYTVRKPLENYLKKLNEFTEERFRKELRTDDTLANMWYSNSDLPSNSTHRKFAKFPGTRSRRDLRKRKSSVIAKVSSKRIFDKSCRKSKLKNFSIQGFYLKKKKHSKTAKQGSSGDMSSTSRETAVIVNKSKWKRLLKAQLKLGLENSDEESLESEMECKIISPKRKKLKLDNKKKNGESGTPKKSREILTNNDDVKHAEYQEAVSQTTNDGEQSVERYKEAVTQTAVSNAEEKKPKTSPEETTSDLEKQKKKPVQEKVKKESPAMNKMNLIKNRSLTCVRKSPRLFPAETSQRFFIENLDSRRKCVKNTFELKKEIPILRLNETSEEVKETPNETIEKTEVCSLEKTEVKEEVAEDEYKLCFFKNPPKEVDKAQDDEIKREKSKIPLVKGWRRKEIGSFIAKPVEKRAEGQQQKQPLAKEDRKNIVKKDEPQSSVCFTKVKKPPVGKSFSAESLNSLSRTFKRKNKKRPHICVRNSKHFIRKTPSPIKKTNKVENKSNYRSLPGEEQLKNITEDVAKYLRQNFVGIEQQPNTEMNIVKGIEEIMIKNLKPSEETPKGTPAKEAIKQEGKQEPRVVKRPRQGIPRLKKEIKSKIPTSQRPKEEPPTQKPVHDFVKLNKLMAGQFKRKTSPATKVKSTTLSEPKQAFKKRDKIPQKEEKESNKLEHLEKNSQNSEKTEPKNADEPESLKSSPSGMEIQKISPPKTRFLPAYMMTSYLPPPMEIVQNQKKQMNRYVLNNDTYPSEENSKQEKVSDFTYKKDLEYLVRLQSCIHGENALENPMNYVKSLLGQDCSGPTVLTETSNETFDCYKPLHYSDSCNSGLVLIEMSDFLESSTSNSDMSGYFKLNQIESLSQQLKNKICVKKAPQESGDPGIVNPIINHNVQEDWRGDSNYDCQIFITLSANSNETECATSLSTTEENSGRTQELTNQSSTYSEISSSQSITMKHRKKRKENEISVEMKQKLLEILETEIKREMGVEWGGSGEASDYKVEDGERNQRSQSFGSFDNMEVLAQISETMRQYLSTFKEGKLPRSTDGPE